MKGRLAHLIGMLLTIIAMGGIVEAGSDDKKGIADLDFSWDTVPKFLYISGKKQFTPEELDYIARNFYWVTFAIGFGGDDHETYDEALGFAAAELKKIHPRIKVLYYWNAARCIHNYGEIGEEFEKHPEWDISKGAMGFNKNRIPIRLQKGKTTPEVNVADPGARRWWLDNAFRALDLPYIDGLRVDATARIYNPGARKTLERAGIFEESEKGLHLMYDELVKYYRKNNGLLIGNFLREHDDYPYEQIWPYFDGSVVENHYNLIGEKIPLKEYGEKSQVSSKRQGWLPGTERLWVFMPAELWIPSTTRKNIPWKRESGNSPGISSTT